MTVHKQVNEIKRTYWFSNDDKATFDNVRTVGVSDSGNHYIKYGKEKIMLAIIAPGWQNIEIDPGEKADWTF